MIAALYVETGGVYFGLDDVDPWDEQRDARLYDGPWPVVAHPPCQKWSPLAYINRRRIPGYAIGDDGGCFEAALAAVRRFGGVLEHPAGSLAWKHFGLPAPTRDGWMTTNSDEGWTTEVDQGVYGHRARKRTWLFAVNCGAELDWSIGESDAIVSGFTHQPRGEHVACETRRVRPAEASRTPIAFRDVLLDMVRSARVYRARDVSEAATTVATVAQLRDLHRASATSAVVHHPTCRGGLRFRNSPTVPLRDDPRYWRGELRPCRVCAPVVPVPDAPPDEPGYLHALPI